MKSNAKKRPKKDGTIKGFRKNFAKGVEPTSQWKFEEVKNFCTLSFKSYLRFKQLEDVSLLPEAKAFAACPARKDDITAGRWCVTPSDLTDETVKGDAYRAFALLRLAIKEPTTEAKVDALALQLAALCGFHDGENFVARRDMTRFQFCGSPCRSAADLYICKMDSASPRALLLFENKSVAADYHMGDAPLRKAAAQIVGEMISLHCRNWSHGNKPYVVYAVRLVNDMAAFFRLEMTAEQIKAVCKDGVVPNPKLQVDYVPKKALEGGDEYGVSLLDPDNRLFFVQMMACIREEMLEREVPELQSFTSERAAKRIKREDL